MGSTKRKSNAGSIKRKATGEVEIRNVTFNANDMDENMIQLALDVFGGFFSRAVELQKVSIRMEELYHDVNTATELTRIRSGWSFELIPWEGHALYFRDAGNREYVLG